jgi:hypothetical protein
MWLVNGVTESPKPKDCQSFEEKWTVLDSFAASPEIPANLNRLIYDAYH